MNLDIRTYSDSFCCHDLIRIILHLLTLVSIVDMGDRSSIAEVLAFISSGVQGREFFAHCFELYGVKLELGLCISHQFFSVTLVVTALDLGFLLPLLFLEQDGGFGNAASMPELLAISTGQLLNLGLVKGLSRATSP